MEFPQTEVDEYLSSLRKTAKKRIAFDALLELFLERFPHLLEDPDRTTHLFSMLEQLDADGHLQQPSVNSKSAWFLSCNSGCPKWVTLTSDEGAASDSLRRLASETMWVKELHFAPELRLGKHIELALTINEFLKQRKGNMMMVPLRERSLQIFGDEKRLDSLVKKSSLFSGRMPLSDIGAFEVEPPLSITKYGGSGQAILVVENYHSFWSLCRWNEQSLEYRAIVYGAGNSILKSKHLLKNLIMDLEVPTIEYLGDLDEAGFRIAIALFNAFYCEPRFFFPAERFYKWLFEFGCKRACIEPATVPSGMNRFFTDQSLAFELCNLISEQEWIPQESLGLEDLVFNFLA